MIRSNCSDCESARITWMSSRQLVDRVAPDRREQVQEGHEFFRGRGIDVEAWLCKDCGCFGILQVGGFAF